MKTVNELYEALKNLPIAEQTQKLKENAAILKTLPAEKQQAFYHSLQESLDKLQQDSKELQRKVEQAFIDQQLAWLNDPIINKNEVCRKLYGKDDSSTRGYFAQQRKGSRPWKPGQLERLAEIKQEVMQLFSETQKAG